MHHTDGTPDGRFQTKRQRILSLHKKLHNEQKPSLEYIPTAAKDTTGPKTISKADVRKLLGDPLPLPYTIHSRDPNKTTNTIASLREEQLLPKQPTRTSTTATVSSTGPAKWENDRLRASIENMLRPVRKEMASAPAPEVEHQHHSPELTTPVPLISPPYLDKAFSMITPPHRKAPHFQADDPSFTSSSPPRRIKDLKDKDQVLMEFRNQLNATSPGDQAALVEPPRQKMFTTTSIIFVILVIVLYWVLKS